MLNITSFPNQFLGHKVFASSPVESLQHWIICQRDLVHEEHSSLLHRLDQGSIMPVKQPAVLIISLQMCQENMSHNQLQSPNSSNPGLITDATWTLWVWLFTVAWWQRSIFIHPDEIGFGKSIIIFQGLIVGLFCYLPSIIFSYYRVRDPVMKVKWGQQVWWKQS